MVQDKMCPKEQKKKQKAKATTQDMCNYLTIISTFKSTMNSHQFNQRVYRQKTEKKKNGETTQHDTDNSIYDINFTCMMI